MTANQITNDILKDMYDSSPDRHEPRNPLRGPLVAIAQLLALAIDTFNGARAQPNLSDMRFDSPPAPPPLPELQPGDLMDWATRKPLPEDPYASLDIRVMNLMKNLGLNPLKGSVEFERIYRILLGALPK